MIAELTTDHRTAAHEFIPLLRHAETRRLQPPALLLAGESDPFTPPKMMESASMHAVGLRFEVIDKAGHHLPEESPEAVADKIRDLLSRA